MDQAERRGNRSHPTRRPPARLYCSDTMAFRLRVPQPIVKYEISNAWQLLPEPPGSPPIYTGLHRRTAGTRSGRAVAMRGLARLLRFGIRLGAGAVGRPRRRDSQADGDLTSSGSCTFPCFPLQLRPIAGCPASVGWFEGSPVAYRSV